MSFLEVTRFFGLKWNPFSSEIPAKELFSTERGQFFLFNVENLVFEGGFMLLTGSPGSGKSAILRQVEHRFHEVAEVRLRVFTRPQSTIRDFYRELSDLFGVPMKISNRFGGFKTLREEWNGHIKESLFRSVLIIDEAQEMPIETLAELRLLSSLNLDSQNILGVILSGDERLISKLAQKELEPLKSRLKLVHRLSPLSPEELSQHISHNLQSSGATENLFDKDVIRMLCRGADGNLRTCMNLFSSLLLFARQKHQKHITQKTLFEWQKSMQGRK